MKRNTTRVKIFLINSKEESICPCCGSPLKYRDSRRRVHKIAGGDKEWYLIRRLKCTGDKCGRLHNELPDCICPYKHYDAGLIEDVADGVVSEEDTETEDYPCEGTMKHWRWWLHMNEKNMEGQIRAAAHRFLDLDGKFLKSRVSLLEEMKERISPGWLKAVVRAIKYGPELRTTDGGLIKTYLSSLIDDHSRYIVQSEFYDNQRQEIVEDTFHKAVLKAGKFDCAYLDNGVQYTSGHLGKACAKLGIRIVHAKPGACQSKGKIEKFHQKVDQFIAEIRVAHVHSVEELNRRWKIFLEQEYQKEAHAGIKEYYESYGTSVPASGITPEQEWMRDERGLVFMDVSVVAEAFLHRERRRIDEAGCFSLGGNRYEASAALSNLEAEVAYDPMEMDMVTVYCCGASPVRAHRMEIGTFASKVPPVPLGMTGNIPEASRLLDALEKKYKEDHGQMARALSFGEYGKEAGSHV